ncbi:prolipoprotein diacylglyceryl transferase [Jeotgalicoccus sp. S0W5]|uniref:prolipoprotein diacylglyceryl transferase n=1 Tax=Jeotgalicoccus sp. S0W5 TaxID=2527874 RepID=UPI0014152215|nr:prolipoprotein diacylglyceryl transferase [Jeotgalicoccus sp. S0W5]
MILNAAIDPVAISLGPLSIHWYGIIILTGMILGYFLAKRETIKRGLPDDLFMDLMMYIIIFSLIGARLYYVLFNLDYYLFNPIDIIKVYEGGMAIHGGLIGGFLAGLIYTKKKGYSFFQIADIAAPSILLGQAIGRWGNFINQEAHGGPVSRDFLENLMIPEFIINHMNIDGTYYHPTFLYESVWSIIGVVILLLIRPKLKIGDTILVYLVYYSIGRFFIEGMRTDSLMIFDLLRTAQVISIVIIVVAIGAMIYRHRQYNLPQYNEVYGNYLSKGDKPTHSNKSTVVNKKKKRKK